MQLYWGDFHRHVETPEDAERALTEVKGHLDVYPALLYPYEWQRVNGLMMETTQPNGKHDRIWEEIRAVVASHDNPGSLVTMMALEWHGNRQNHGDYNVFYFRHTPKLTYPDTLKDLYNHLRHVGGIAIPHHIAYGVGHCGANWAELDPQLSPVIDIYSAHGSSESEMRPDLLPFNASMGPGVSGATATDALNQGLRVGLIASNDGLGLPGSWGLGLAAIWAEELTREGILNALRKRQVYGVTGDRIQLSFNANEQPMGSILETTDPLELSVDVTGSNAIDRIELIRNGSVIDTYCHAGRWQPNNVNGHIRGKFRFQFGWGPDTSIGFKHQNQNWNAHLQLTEGAIRSIEPCFSCFGQSIQELSRQSCKWRMHTTARHGYATDRHTIQGMVFEIDAPSNAIAELQVDGHHMKWPLMGLLQHSQLVPMLDEAKQRIKEQFGLGEEDLQGHDPLFHAARKVKAEVGVLSEGYTVQCQFKDQPPAGRESYYYVRVTQINGQMAWSSPIWVNA